MVVTSQYLLHNKLLTALASLKKKTTPGAIVTSESELPPRILSGFMVLSQPGSVWMSTAHVWVSFHLNFFCFGRRVLQGLRMDGKGQGVKGNRDT